MHPLKKKLLDKIQDMPPEFIEIVDANFWELVDGENRIDSMAQSDAPGCLPSVREAIERLSFMSKEKEMEAEAPFPREEAKQSLLRDAMVLRYALRVFGAIEGRG